MKLSIPKRFLIITAVCYILSIVFFFVLNFIQFEPKSIDTYFRSGWIFNKTFLQFFKYLIPVQCTAVIFTFSVFFPRLKSESGMELLTSKNFNTLVTVVIIILICLTALFFIGNEILSPRFHEKLDTYSYLTKTGRAYLDQAETAAETGKLLEAEDAIKKYLAIKPEDESAQQMFRDIKKRIENQYSLTGTDTDPEENVENYMNLDYSDALRLARMYLENEDYYSAYYYARIASDLSGGKGEASTISSKAWTLLSDTAPSKEETAEYQFFSEKKRGSELLLGKKPIEAYYLFNRLSIEHPDDPDVEKYLAESIRETRKLTYFINEAEEALNFPGITEICFLNTNTDELREIIYFGKMVSLPSGTYFENIEAVSINSSGIKTHVTARYGKLIGEHIVLNGIDRDNRNFRLYPDYIVADKLPEIFNTLKLNVDRNHLSTLSSSGNIYKKMNIIELIELQPVISAYGWMEEPLHLEIISRILNPCGFIILSLLTIAVGWQYRKFQGKVPVAGFVFLPVVVYIVSLFTESYLYAVRLFCFWIYLSLNRAAAVSLISLSQLGLLITAFLLIAALRSSDDEPAA